MKSIVLCSSANFYKHLNEVADQLEKMGFKAVTPHNAREMRKKMIIMPKRLNLGIRTRMISKRNPITCAGISMKLPAATLY
jgi:hypothetical protein